MASALATLFTFLADRPAFAQADKLEGAWSVTETILSGCPGDPVRTVPDMNLFIHGGTMVEVAATLGIGAPPLIRGNPGLGTWEHVTQRHFKEHFTFFRYDPTADAFAGTMVVNKDIELSKDGDAFTSTGTADIFDQNGTFITTRCTIGSATRSN
jgi:hypothetical protein